MANVPQNVTMNSTAFPNNVNTILSKYIPSITDSMIWWFAAQSLTTQSQLISQLCTNKIPLQAVMNRYSSINATFNLPVQIQTQMIDCVDRLSNGAAVPSFLNSKIQPSSVFLWNPFTPKSYLWFAGLDETRQFGIIHLICMDVRFDALTKLIEALESNNTALSAQTS
ncbi:hypothetical protein BCR33DRAFT_771587 [Rhizoclosmatium globosum]|uniref:Uncharacterized protein n=1 Tax=Rhizoclosmatium globosum TaxID=329046 RepID=A0A1Y2BB50_9FUNG|nr:hypothetical protein BCR33DRAFT_771587 [Rhizoclosmatium globosum]|eukprot:ORY32062.1 hypothetical protein BCR33DRAFT_771587 [Rhizoclosmatium globosum]